VLALPHGWDVDSRDLAQQIRIRSAKDDLETVGDAVVDPRQTTAFAHYRTNLTLHHANCAIYSGTVAEGAVAVMLALHQALAPGARMIGSSGICTAAWASPADGGLPASLDQDLYCTAPGPGPQATPEGQRFIKLYRKAYHAAPDPAAVYGYEAMTLALEVIAAEGAHGDSRQSVLQFLEIAGADESAIGRFSIEEDGDILASYPYSVYGVSRGRLVFDTTPGVGTKLVGAHAGHIETDG
jgi:ABC-type branched-subunit amino acid transport system substrate-binding protein